MSRRYIIYEKDGQIVRITLNKPEMLNALSFVKGDDGDEFFGSIEEASCDPEVKVVVIQGAGRAFCSGQDMNTVGGVYGWETPKPGEHVRPPSQRIRLDTDRRSMNDRMSKVLYCPKITITKLHGYALGGGLMLGMLSDLTLAAEDCKLGMPQEHMAFAGGGGMSPIFFVHMIGWKRARAMALTGRLFNGKEAERMGLVTKAVPADKLDDLVNKTAETMTLIPSDAIAMGKAATHLALDQMGFSTAFVHGYIMHTMGTNQQMQPGEFNFFKERRDKGTRDAMHERDTKFQELAKLLAPDD